VGVVGGVCGWGLFFFFLHVFSQVPGCPGINTIFNKKEYGGGGGG